MDKAYKYTSTDLWILFTPLESSSLLITKTSKAIMENLPKMKILSTSNIGS